MTARKPQPKPCPFQIPTTQMARGLIRMHARLRGELAKINLDEEILVPIEEAQAAMVHIEGVLAFIGVDFVPSLIKPIITHP
jgi:hypothetical protein